jgi:hypothetical protein
MLVVHPHRRRPLKRMSVQLCLEQSDKSGGKLGGWCKVEERDPRIVGY